MNQEWDTDKVYSGTWWIPGVPNVSFVGELSFKRGAPSLQLQVPAYGQGHYAVGNGTPVVVGIIEGGHEVTLWDEFGFIYIYLPDISDDVWSYHRRQFSHAILGKHVSSYTDARFATSTVRYGGLADWSRLPDTTSQHPHAVMEDFDNAGVQVTISIENPQRLEERDGFPYPVISAHSGQEVEVRFVCDPPASAKLHDLLHFDMQAFMTVMFQTSAQTLVESFTLKDGGQTLGVACAHPSEKENAGKASAHSAVVRAADFDPSIVWPKWWLAIDELFPLTQILAMRFNSGGRIVEGSTSAAIAAAERVHEILGSTRFRFTTKYLKRARARLREQFAASEDAEYLAYLIENSHTVRPTLETKLTELFALLTPETVEALGITEQQWIVPTKAVRNKLAHSGSHVNRRGPELDSQLDEVDEQTRAILTLVLLGYLGVPKYQIVIAAATLHHRLVQEGALPPQPSQ